MRCTFTYDVWKYRSLMTLIYDYKKYNPHPNFRHIIYHAYYLNVYLKLWIATKICLGIWKSYIEKERETKSHLLGHFSNDCTCWGWVRQKPGTWNLIWISSIPVSSSDFAGMLERNWIGNGEVEKWIHALKEDGSSLIYCAPTAIPNYG